jgi:predicted acylesterase/phospholipase RssA
MDENITEEVKVIEKQSSKIKHIVCSGGGATGFAYYGIIRESHKMGLWKLEEIDTIYGTSVGSIFAVLLALNYDWETMDDFLIKRPWQNVFKFDMYSLMGVFNKKGIFDINSFRDTFLPAFKGKDVPIDINMKDFFDLTKIEIHIFTTELNTFKTIDISHKTHPEWRVVDAVYSSSSVPIIFTPYLIDGNCYCDGGLLINYPLKCCVENGANPDEILGLNYHPKDEMSEIGSESTLLDYIMLIIRKLIKIILDHDKINIKYEYEVNGPSITIYDIYNCISNMDERIRLIKLGSDMVNL